MPGPWSGRWDHPRGCGEHSEILHPHQIVNRIIPADAGSTARTPLMTLISRDHPRGCGEHLSHGSIRAPDGGSSPRMRGAQLAALSPGEYVGIIPADAGSTNIKEALDLLA